MIPGMPLGPAQRDEGHPALSSASDLARGGDQAHGFAEDQHAPSVQEQHSDPGAGGLIALLDTARVPDAIVNGMHAWVEGGSKQQARPEDTADEDAATQTLHALWENGAPKNFESLRKFVATLPPDEQALFMHARDPAGRLFANDPSFLLAISGLARTRGSAVGELATIEQIEKFMKTNRARYDADPALQQRLRDLYDERERAKG